MRILNISNTLGTKLQSSKHHLKKSTGKLHQSSEYSIVLYGRTNRQPKYRVNVFKKKIWLKMYRFNFSPLWYIITESNQRDQQFINSFFFIFEKTTYCCRTRRLSVLLSVRLSVLLSVRLSVCVNNFFSR